MPRTPKYTPEQIVDAAFAIVREDGEEALSARTLAARLGCSVRPIFGQFAGMEDVRHAVWRRAREAYNGFIAEAMRRRSDKPYLSSGLAYVDFARTEPQLFAMLFMRPRTDEEMAQAERDVAPIVRLVAAQLGVGYERAYDFHMQLWVHVHGLATMIATRYLTWDAEFVERSASQVYLALKAALDAEQAGRTRQAKRGE